MNTLTATISQGANITGSNNVAGLGAGPGSGNNLSKTDVFKQSIANGAVLGADEVHEKLYTIVGAGTVTIDLTAVVDLAGQTITFARIKFYRFHLLRAAETALDGTVGTACSGVTIGNAAANANLLDLGGTTPTMSLKNGGCKSHTDLSAAGITVDATHKNILITNNDAVNTAQLLVTFGGGST